MKFIFITILFSAQVFAAKPSFTVMVKRKYDKIWFNVSQEKNKWICETTHFPYFEATENPLDGMDWNAIEKESKKVPKPCANIVAMANNLKGKERRTVTCLTQPATLLVYERVSRLCQSKI